MADDKKDVQPAEGEAGKTEQDPQVTDARVPGDDPRLAGHALQDHDRVRAELDPNPSGNPDDLHRGNPVRSNPDLVPGPRNKALERVRERREENEARARTHNRTIVEETVSAVNASGTEKQVEITTADGRLYLNTHGEAILNQDGVIDLRRKLDMAFQAVS